MGRLYRSMVIAVCFAACVPTAQHVPDAPPTNVANAEPTRPPSCPSTYPDPPTFDDHAYRGSGTVVTVIDREQLRVTVDVPRDHAFSGQTLLLHLHGSARIPGGLHDLVAYGLKPGDRVDLDLWHFLPADCSYLVTQVQKIA